MIMNMQSTHMEQGPNSTHFYFANILSFILIKYTVLKVILYSSTATKEGLERGSYQVMIKLKVKNAVKEQVILVNYENIPLRYSWKKFSYDLIRALKTAFYENKDRDIEKE